MLLLTLVITWIIHNEYLSYASQSENQQYLALSYVIKWGVFIIAVSIYYFAVERKVLSSSNIKNTIRRPREKESKGDGFDFLRQKRTLESAADKAVKNPLRK